MAAAFAGVPRVILEPNADPGHGEQGWWGRLCSACFSHSSRRPTRSIDPRFVWWARRSAKQFLDRRNVHRQRRSQPGRQHLLIFGGSQGAKAINSAVIEGLPPLLKARAQMTVMHQTGESDYARVSAAYRQSGVSVSVAPFLYDMPSALHAADLVVARAGAMTVAELTACGKPAILIPLPTAIYDHQMKNAKAMEAAGAAVVLPQTELTGSNWHKRLRRFWRSKTGEGDGECESEVTANRRGRGDRPRMLCTHRGPL